MNRRTFLASAAAFAASFAAFRPARAQTLSYGPAELDIHPAGKGAPVVVNVHGGGWRIGSRRRVEDKPAFFNRLGWTFVSIDYRMLPEAPVEVQKADVAAAVGWVRANAESFGADGRHILLMGHSAGAHLAALAAMDGSAGPLAGLFCNDGQVYDVAAFAALQGGRLRGLWLDAFGDDPARWPALSPAQHAGRHKLPPTLIAWSGMRGRDALSIDFARRIRAAGGRATTFDGAAYSHMSINRQLGAKGDAGITAAVAAFMRTL